MYVSLHCIYNMYRISQHNCARWNAACSTRILILPACTAACVCVCSVCLFYIIFLPKSFLTENFSTAKVAKIISAHTIPYHTLPLRPNIYSVVCAQCTVQCPHIPNSEDRKETICASVSCCQLSTAAPRSLLIYRSTLLFCLSQDICVGSVNWKQQKEIPERTLNIFMKCIIFFRVAFAFKLKYCSIDSPFSAQFGAACSHGMYACMMRFSGCSHSPWNTIYSTLLMTLRWTAIANWCIYWQWEQLALA